jgi:hypothetical protein
MPVPDFAPGEILTAAAMDAIGLWRITTCTVSSVGGTAATASNGVITIGTGNTSVTVSNAFSSNYDNYLITVQSGSSSATTNLRLAIGSVNSGYSVSVLYTAWSNTPTPLATGALNASSWTIAGSCDPDGLYMWLNVSNPFLTKRTAIHGAYVGVDTDRVGGSISGFVTDATSQTAFTISPDTGTITGGTIRVYGYRN